MKLYIVSGKLDMSQDGTKFAPSTRAFASQAECASERKRLTDRGLPRKAIDTFEIDMPTNKEGVLNFMNTLLSTEFTQDGVKAAAAAFALTKK